MQRFQPTTYCDPCDDGRYVLFADAEKLQARIAELEKALMFYAKSQAVRVWDKTGAYHEKGQKVARKALGL